MEDYDIVVIQELVAPPFAGTFPNREPFRADPEAAEFFTAMADLGFAFVLSAEDTGSSVPLHNNGPGTEWFAAFYNPQRVDVADDLPQGYLADTSHANPQWDRVPHAFAFRSEDGTFDSSLFPQYYSYHHPVAFQLRLPGDGDDD